MPLDNLETLIAHLRRRCSASEDAITALLAPLNSECDTRRDVYLAIDSGLHLQISRILQCDADGSEEWYIQDQTELQHCREQLQSQQSRFQGILDAIPTSIHTLTSDAKLGDYNSTFAREIHASMGVEVARGFDFNTFRGWGNSDRWEHYLREAFAGESFSAQWETVTPFGSHFLDVSFVPLAVAPQPEVVVVVRNLTEELKGNKEFTRASSRAKLALESARAVAFEYDVQTDTFQTSDLRLVGIAGPQNFSVDWWIGHIEEEDRDRVRRVFEDSLRDSECISVTYCFRDSEGTLRDLQSEGHILRNELGHPQAIIGITQDVTRAKALERKLIESLHLAEEMNRLKTAFLANMSHEIRTPLTAVVGFAQILAEELTDPRQLEYTDRIINSGRRIVSTIHSILDYASIEAGTFPVDSEPFELVTTVRTVVDGFRSAAATSQLHLTLADDGVMFTVAKGKHCVERILQCLVDNAIKFTSAGMVCVQVSVAPDGARVDVMDTGCGIKDTRRIFDPFVQGDLSSNRVHEGCGLGLAIARGLAEAIGASLSVSCSEVGRGSCFSLKLPAQPVNG